MTQTRPLMPLLFAAIALGAGCARNHLNGTGTQPAVETIHHSRTYEVNPLNPQDLMRSISDQWRCGGFECKFGETQSNTTYTFSSASTSAGGCAVSSAHVKVETMITLPHWEPQGVTSPARRNWWANIQAAVTRHEHQHVFIAEDGGKALADSLMHLRATSCFNLVGMTAATYAGEMSRVAKRQNEFDLHEGPLQITAPPP